MLKGVVFGAGGTGRHVYEMNKDSIDIQCFVDNDKTKWGMTVLDKKVENPEILKTMKVDVVLLGTLMGADEVPEQLAKYGIDAGKIDKTYVSLSVKARIAFLYRFAEMAYSYGIQGSVGEAGVYRGEFAKHINKAFYDRKCYLFDTFEGFDERDFAKEANPSLTFANHLKNVSMEETLAKMPIKANIVVKKGYFPETAKDVDDKFAFVNLDMDLYEHTIGGLRYFYDRMSDGGVILVHDYFNKVYPNIKKSIDDFEKESGIRLRKMPVGDDITIAIVK